MKKVVLSLMLTFALALGIAAPALAAGGLPVFVEGQKIAEPALVKNGVSYLPMRALLEALGAKVDWDAKNQTVIAVQSNGHQTKIPLQGEHAEVTYHKGDDVYVTASADLTERSPFMQRGRVYLPVRTVSELLGYDVAYTKDRVTVAAPKLTYDDGKGGVYTLNLLSGELTLTQAGGKKTLGRSPLLSTRSASVISMTDLQVEETPNGNYLATCGGYRQGALTNSMNVYAWLPKAGGEAVAVYNATVFDPHPDSRWLGDVLWLPGEGETYAVDDKTGQVTAYKTADMYGEERYDMCYWTDGRFMLMGSGADFDIYDIKTKQLTDMKTAMLEPDVKAQVQTFMQENSWEAKTPEKFEHLWQYLGNSFAAIPGGDEVVYLRFVRAADNVLYFDLVVHYWAIDDEGGIAGERDKMFSVTYTLPQ